VPFGTVITGPVGCVALAETGMALGAAALAAGFAGRLVPSCLEQPAEAMRPAAARARQSLRESCDGNIFYTSWRSPNGMGGGGRVDPFAESNCEQRSERWVSVELEEIVLDCADEFAGNKSACRSRYRPIGQAVAANPCPANSPR